MLLSDKIILTKIVRLINSANKFMGDIQQSEFMDNEMLQNAVTMIALRIGELVKGLSFEFRRTNPQVQWKAIAGFRDIVAHRYETLNMNVVYIAITQEFPIIKTQILDILAEEDNQ